MNVIKFETHPEKELNVFLFDQVKNAKDIHQKLIKKQLPFDIAFINATLVSELVIIQSAANKALFALTENNLRCHNVITEIVCNLSGSRNIAPSLKTFGIAESGTQSLIVAAFNLSKEQIDYIHNLINGIELNIEELDKINDKKSIKNIYKVTDEELKIGTLTDAVLCRIAAHDIDIVK